MLNWRGRKLGLSNIYRNIDPDIILINSQGIPDDETLKISGYKTHQKNSTGRNHDGTAIAIKSNIPHKIYDSFISDLLAIEVETNTGPIIISTLYQPPQ